MESSVFWVLGFGFRAERGTPRIERHALLLIATAEPLGVRVSEFGIKGFGFRV